MTKEISLMESLCGINFVVTSLDGTQFRVKSEEGQVIKPDQIMTIKDKGMPFFKNPYMFGNLFILFKVKYPDTVSPGQKTQIKEVLSSLGQAPMANDGEDEIMEMKFMEPFEKE